MTDVMVDLETLSTKNNAAIAVIAAIKFNLDAPLFKLTEVPEAEKFYRRIDIESCKNIELDVDEKTIAWWKTQPEEPQKEIFENLNRVQLIDALKDFSLWFGKFDRRIWSQGANFDIPILSEAYQRFKIQTPWKFWNARDTRTLYQIADFSYNDDKKEMLHHALHDCQRQINAVKHCYQPIKKARTFFKENEVYYREKSSK